MSYYFSPVGNSPWVDSNGDPLVGGYWRFFLAGTSTPVAVYTDNTGTVAQPADLVLQSNGMAFSPIWLQGGIAVKARLFTSAGVAVANGTFDNISGIDDPAIASSVDQWVPYTGAATYISATSFSVDGDQTNDFQVLRRVRSVNTGGTVYSSISVSSFGAGITTVTVVNDSGTLDSGLSAVSYGLLSNTNPSIPETNAGRGARLATATVVNRGYAEYAANTNLTTVIPFDDTIPQVGEGTQILSVAITPQSTTSRLRVRFQGWGSAANAGDSIVNALFVNGAADAVAATCSEPNVGAGSVCGACLLEYEYAPGSVSAQTITLRVGGVAGTIRMNGSTAARRFGGVSRSTLVVEEIAV